MAGWKNGEARKSGQRKGLLRGTKDRVEADNFFEPGVDFRIAEKAEAMKEESASHKRGMFGKLTDLKDRFTYWSSGGGSKMNNEKRNWLAEGKAGSWRHKKALRQAYNDVNSGYQWAYNDIETQSMKNISDNNEEYQKGGDTSRLMDPRYTSLFADKHGIAGFVTASYASNAEPILKAYDEGKITEADKDEMLQGIASNIQSDYESSRQSQAATDVSNTTGANSSGFLPQDDLMVQRYVDDHYNELPGTKKSEKKEAAIRILGIDTNRLSSKYQGMMCDMVSGVAMKSNEHNGVLVASNARGFAKQSADFTKRTGVKIGGLGDN